MLIIKKEASIMAGYEENDEYVYDKVREAYERHRRYSERKEKVYVKRPSEQATYKSKKGGDNHEWKTKC